jgi:hypothetical protein
MNKSLEKQQKANNEVISAQIMNPVPTLNARDIMRTEFPDVPWVVPGLIPPGPTLIASRPKLGKSWFCLNSFRKAALTSGPFGF